ncbi:fibronectin type III domain-containing protein [Georgenia sp. MJ206]|uniref:fibronectin type III domain-containing protein n=1 Tax=Georgenia wangjunii TaxID=3117730 RepID=UPI002F26B3BD
MAIKWGAFRSTPTQSARLGIDATVSGNPASGSVTVTVRYYLEHTQAVAQSQTINRTGTITGAVPINAARGVVSTGAYTVTVPTVYGSAGTRHFGAFLSGHYAGLSPSVDVNVTIPARPYLAPNPPPALSSSRSSDTQINVSWTTAYTGADGARPWTGVYLERWDNVRDGHVVVATLPWSTSSYSDRSTVGNRRYVYRIRAYNAAGTSAYTYGSMVVTTPAAPGTPEATKDTTDVVLQWSRNAYPEAVYQVHHAADGVWDAAPLVTTAANAWTWTHVDPDPAVTHTYRVRASHAGLLSPYSAASNVIQLLAAPLAPTNLAPTGTIDSTGSEVLSWRHQSVDGTSQTAYELERRLKGTTSWTTTGKTTSSLQQRTALTSWFVNGSEYEWRVRTWGQHATASPWSAIASFRASAKPTASINSPSSAEPVGSSSVTVTWGYYHAEGTAQTQYRARLYDDAGTLLETRTGYSAATEATFSRALGDATTYQVGVEVRNGYNQWSSEDRVTFTVSYPPPPAPQATASWDKGAGVVVVTITNPPYGEGEVDVDHNQLYRAINDGPWVLIAANVPPNGTVSDTTAVVGGVNHYQVAAVSALPSSKTGAPVAVPVSAEAADHWVYLNAGPGFSQVVRVRAGAKLDHTPTRKKEVRFYLGRQDGVEYSGRTRGRTGSLSVRLTPDTGGASNEAEITALADMPAPICLRDPLGHRWFVSMGAPHFSHVGATTTLDFDFTVVGFDE